jgi:hypothetical protein
VPLSDGRILSLRLEDGSVEWERQLGGPPEPILPVRDRLYVGSADNYFYCLRGSDGQVHWRWRTGGDIIGMAAHDDRRVYFASLDNLLRALDLNNGAQRWKMALPLRPIGGPLAVDETLLVAGLGPGMHGYAVKDGAARGDLDTGGLPAAPPYLVPAPDLPGPLVVYVARSVTAGLTMTAVTRAVEPPIVEVSPLPNPTPVVPLSSEKTDAAPSARPAASPDRRNR